MAVLQATTITGGLTMHGMAAGFVKLNAEGAVVMDTATYATTASLSSYLPLSGGTISGNLTINGTWQTNISTTGGWSKLSFTASNAWGDGTTYGVLGAGGGAEPGVMTYNQHATWVNSSNGAGIRMGRSGGVSSGAWYQVATMDSDEFMIAKNGSWGNGGIKILSNGAVNYGNTGYRFVHNNGTWDINITGNADTVDGYHATNAASGLAYYASNGYLYLPSWMNVDNGGIYSNTNSAHLRPNSGTYGSWLMTGSRNSWRGIEFESGNNGNVTLMIHTSSNTTGFHNNSYGWQFYWESGSLYVLKNSYGGGTQATVLDSSNYTSWAAPRNFLDGLSVGFHVYGDANTYYPVLISAHGHFGMHRYSISRSYSDTAPWDPIGTGAHKGGLTLTFDWSSDIAWGGNDKSYRIIQFSETYTTMVAGMALPVTGGMLVWLRGGGAGGAFYRLHTPGGLNASATAYMSGYTAANGAFYGIRTDTSNVNSEIRSRFPVRDSGNGDLYVNNNIVWHQGNLTNLNQLTNGPGYLTSLGFSYSTGVNANHVVQRDANGYIYANHINFNTSESENPAISSFFTSNGDGWSRKSSIAHVRNQLGNYGNWITASSLSSYLPLSGGTMSGNLYIQSGANPTQFNLRGTNPELYVDAAYGGGTARLFINRASSGNQATLHFTTGYSVSNGTAWNSTGMPLWTLGMTNSSQTSDFKIAYGDIYDAASVAIRIDTGLTVYFTNTPYVGGNAIATQSWVTSQGYASSGSFLSLSGGTVTGTTNIRNLYVGDSGSSWSNPDGWGTTVWMSHPDHSILRVQQRSQGIQGGLYAHVNNPFSMGSWSNHDVRIMRSFSTRMTFYSGYTYSEGYLQAADSLRAPIFYDSNDTNYYVDPNSNSYLSRLHVADASSGVSMHVGVGSTHGVYTLDNARKYLVVSGDYYPHMAIVARYANNTNHGAVFSFVGSEGGAFRQWNLGISNNNPFLFSIGYNRTTDPNPHYGIGDGWSGSDFDHARLSIDRDGNTKIRGMLYVNGTSGGISTGNPVLHSGNFSSWALSRGGDTMDNILYFRTNQGAYSGSLSSAKLQVYNDNNQSAFMSFHRSGQYAVNFGLDQDNVLRIGGWSASANRWELDMSGNNTVAGSFRAPQFRFTNSSNSAYLTGNSNWGFTVVNDNGYIQFGPANSSWSHIYSDKSFYFNQELYVNGTQVVKNSGTWSINITGDANTVDGVDSSQIVYGGSGRASNYDSNMNDPNQKSGLYYYPNPTGQPFGDWWNWMTIAGNSWQSSNNYSFQLAHAFHSDDFYVRRMTNGSVSSWRYILTNSNITSYMDAPNKAGTSYYQTNTWMQFNGTHGLYWPSYYGAHLYINSSASYTQFRWDGNKNGYDGVWLSYSAVNGMMYDSGGNGGVYREANGRWYWYHHVGNNCTGISTSSTSSSYRAYIGGSLYAEGDIVAYSDRRKKTDIITIDNALEKVTNLRGVYYTRIDDPNRTRQTGVIAQEINEILPEVVTYAADIDEYGVSYGNIVGVLIEAIKEQQKQIDELKEQLKNR